MKSIVAGLTVLLLTAALVGCASLRTHGKGADNVVTIDLTLVGQTCKPTVNPEHVKATANRPVVRWVVTDNCNQSENEAETQLLFVYQPEPTRKWLDPKTPVARTTRTHNRKPIVYVAVDHGQPDLAEAEYFIYYNGRKIGDPKVVWGR